MLTKILKTTKSVFPFLIIAASIHVIWFSVFNFLPGIEEAQAGVSVGTVTTGSCVECSVMTIASHNISDPDSFIVVGVNLDNGDNAKSVNTVTYNGINLTQLAEVRGGPGGNKGRTEVWYLPPSSNPADGSYDVVISIDGAQEQDMAAGAIRFNGAHQDNPINTDTFQTAGGKATNHTLTVTSKVGDMVMDVITYLDTTLTVGANQTERWNMVIGGSGYPGGASTETGASSVAMSWTFNKNDDYSHIAFNINQLPPPPAPPAPLFGQKVRPIPGPDMKPRFRTRFGDSYQ